MTGLDFRMKIKLGPKAKWNKNFPQELAAFKAPENTILYFYSIVVYRLANFT